MVKPLVSENLLRYSAPMRKLIIVMLGLSAAVTLADTEVYTWKDKDGTVHFSDQPAQGAKKIKVLDVSTVSSPKSEVTAGPKSEAAFIGYTKFAVAAPANNSTIRDNTGAVAVSLALEPALRIDLGHTVRVTLAGQSQSGAATSFAFGGIDRGTHSISATILDKNGTVIKSASSTFTLHKISKLLNPPASSNQPAAPAVPSPPSP